MQKGRSVLIGLALVAVLIACGGAGKPSSSAIWDQSTWDSADWQ